MYGVGFASMGDTVTRFEYKIVGFNNRCKVPHVDLDNKKFGFIAKAV